MESIHVFKEETDYSSRKLKKNQDHYDRVIRPIPLSVLTSSTLPAVALQDGVFYYRLTMVSFYFILGVFYLILI